MKTSELIRKYKSGERQFSGVNLKYAYLYNANLKYAILYNANLENANLRNANLRFADLRNANLENANLKNANLENANLENANLKNANLYANLKNANLENANLENANLVGANLKNANLKYTDLRNANLENTNLTGTILDPQAKIPEISDKEILSAGLEIHGEFVAGYRTTISQHVGNQEYKVGEEYRAPVFSVDKNTPCHPGIYLAPKKWLLDIYPNCEIVRCFCRRDELIHAGDKWRAKRIRVIFEK